MFPGVSVHFSPLGGTERAIVSALTVARTSVLVQAYFFTSALIAAALVEAARRSVKVSLILDRSNTGLKYSEFTFFRNQGLAPLIDSMHAIAHNKVMVIDSALVITGSFNFTTNAEQHNAENCIFLPDADIAALYATNFQAHLLHSRPAPYLEPVPIEQSHVELGWDRRGFDLKPRELARWQ